MGKGIDYMLEAANAVHSKFNEVTRKYEYIIEGFPHLYKTQDEAINDAIDWLKCSTEEEVDAFLRSKYGDNRIEEGGKFITIGDTKGAIAESTKMIRHANVMELIGIDRDNDGEFIFYVKRFTHRYNNKEDVYADASGWYDMEDKQKADNWLLNKYEDNRIDEV